MAVITAAMSIFAAVVWGAEYWSLILNQVDRVPDTIKRSAAYFWHPDWYYNSPKVGMFLLGLGAAAIGTITLRQKLAERKATDPERRDLAIAISFALIMGLLSPMIFCTAFSCNTIIITCCCGRSWR